MKIIVQKFGGSSVADAAQARIRRISMTLLTMAIQAHVAHPR